MTRLYPAERDTCVYMTFLFYGGVIGHTSNTRPKPKACEAVGRYVGKPVAHIRKKGYTILVKADRCTGEILHAVEGMPCDGALAIL